MSTTTTPTAYPALRSCETCAFFRPDTKFHNPSLQRQYARCARFCESCSIAMSYSRMCGRDLIEWHPAPPPPPPKPRRSLRQWIHDTFLA